MKICVAQPASLSTGADGTGDEDEEKRAREREREKEIVRERGRTGGKRKEGGLFANVARCGRAD